MSDNPIVGALRELRKRSLRAARREEPSSLTISIGMQGDDDPDTDTEESEDESERQPKRGRR